MAQRLPCRIRRRDRCNAKSNCHLWIDWNRRSAGSRTGAAGDRRVAGRRVRAANVRIRARIEPNPDNRRITVVADGAAFYRSSEMQLDGEQAPKVIELWFRDVPGGDYEIYAILTDSVGRQRAVAHHTTKVMSPFEGQ
jgi:hypothetical protein